jgi:hyperosmotically inducible protein
MFDNARSARPAKVRMPSIDPGRPIPRGLAPDDLIDASGSKADRASLSEGGALPRFSTEKDIAQMNTKLAALYLLAGALALPIVGHTEDADSDRSSPKAFAKDSLITTKIKAKLFEEHMSSLFHIKVDTDAKGAVVLAGTATDQPAIDKAVTIARGVEGVKSVKNNIKIKADQ